jgi:hypothetical protein
MANVVPKLPPAEPPKKRSGTVRSSSWPESAAKRFRSATKEATMQSVLVYIAIYFGVFLVMHQSSAAGGMGRWACDFLHAHSDERRSCHEPVSSAATRVLRIVSVVGRCEAGHPEQPTPAEITHEATLPQRAAAMKSTIWIERRWRQVAGCPPKRPRDSYVRAVGFEQLCRSPRRRCRHARATTQNPRGAPAVPRPQHLSRKSRSSAALRPTVHLLNRPPFVLVGWRAK